MFRTTVKQLDLESIRTATASAALLGFRLVPQVAGQACLLGRSLAKAGKIQTEIVQAPRNQMGG